MSKPVYDLNLDYTDRRLYNYTYRLKRYLTPWIIPYPESSIYIFKISILSYQLSSSLNFRFRLTNLPQVIANIECVRRYDVIELKDDIIVTDWMNSYYEYNLSIRIESDSKKVFEKKQFLELLKEILRKEIKEKTKEDSFILRTCIEEIFE